MIFNKIKNSLKSTEIYTIIMIIICSIIDVILFNQISNSGLILIINIATVLYIVFCSLYFEQNPKSKFLIFYKTLYIGICYIFYQQMQYYLRIINPFLYDDLLIKLDYWIFGVNPTQFLMKIENKYLTEYLTIAYSSFYVMSLIHAIELYSRKKIVELNELVDLLSFGFYISYLAYFIFPAVGPRFTLHNFVSTYLEMPGIYLANFLRDFVNSGGAIPIGVINPEFYVNRDCFPSGHTMMTLLNIILAFKFKTKLRFLILIFGSSLIFSTVYLRYHYVIDVIFGIIFAILAYKIQQNLMIKINNRKIRI